MQIGNCVLEIYTDNYENDHYRNPGSGVVTCSLWYMSHDRVTEPGRAGATEGRSRGLVGLS